jgi:KTSC domain
MSLIKVNSSSIAAVGFEDGTLAVRFHTSETLYLHHGVPYGVFAGLMRADSKGAYYNENIRGKYK